MDRFDVWDGLLFGAAGYLAVMALVRLMAAHRRRVAADLRRQIQVEQARQREADEREQRAKRKSSAA